MLNNMVASFTASNQIGEAMKKQNLKNPAIKNKDKDTNQKNNSGEGSNEKEGADK